MRVVRSVLNLAKDYANGAECLRRMKLSSFNPSPSCQWELTRAYHKDIKPLAPASPEALMQEDYEGEEDKPSHLYK